MYSTVFTLDEHGIASLGEATDVIVNPIFNRQISVSSLHLELKESASFETICSNHTGLASVYTSEEKYPRISPLCKLPSKMEHNGYATLLQSGEVYLKLLLIQIICLGAKSQKVTSPPLKGSTLQLEEFYHCHLFNNWTNLSDNDNALPHSESPLHHYLKHGILTYPLCALP